MRRRRPWVNAIEHEKADESAPWWLARASSRALPRSYSMVYEGRGLKCRLRIASTCEGACRAQSTDDLLGRSGVAEVPARRPLAA